MLEEHFRQAVNEGGYWQGVVGSYQMNMEYPESEDEDTEHPAETGGIWVRNANFFDRIRIWLKDFNGARANYVPFLICRVTRQV